MAIEGEKTSGDVYNTPETSDAHLRGKISVGKWVRFLRPGTVGTFEGKVEGWYSKDGIHHQPRIQCGPEYNYKEVILDENYYVEGVWRERPAREKLVSKEPPIDLEKEKGKEPPDTKEEKLKKAA